VVKCDDVTDFRVFASETHCCLKKFAFSSFAGGLYIVDIESDTDGTLLLNFILFTLALHLIIQK
jgi:hypothetical protein